MRKHIGKATVFGLVALLIIVASMVSITIRPAQAQNTYRRGTYEVLRTVTATEDTQLTASTQKTAPVRSDDGTVFLHWDQVGAIHLRFKGTGAQNLTLAWTLWGYKDASNPARYVAHGTATTGLTQTGETNEFYCDTIVITAQAYTKTFAVSDGAPDAIISGGGIAELTGDTVEYGIFKLVIRDIAGGGSEMATAGADYSTFR